MSNIYTALGNLIKCKYLNDMRHVTNCSLFCFQYVSSCYNNSPHRHKCKSS